MGTINYYIVIVIKDRVRVVKVISKTETEIDADCTVTNIAVIYGIGIFKPKEHSVEADKSSCSGVQATNVLADYEV